MLPEVCLQSREEHGRSVAVITCLSVEYYGVGVIVKRIV